MSALDAGLGLTAALLWGLTFVASAIALQELPPLFFTALRFVGAAAFVLVVPRPRVPWHVILAAGMLLGAGQYGLLFVGMASGVSPGAASVLIHTQALIMIVLAAAFFSERLAARDAIGAVLALVGIVVLAGARDASGSVAAVALVLAGAVCGGVGNLVLKRAGTASGLGMAVWMSLVPPVPLLVLSLVLEGPARMTTSLATISWQSLAALAYSSVGATVVAFAIWGRLFSRYSAIRTAPFLLTVPLIGLTSSVFWLGEGVSPAKAAGAVLIIVGLATVVLRRRASAGASQKSLDLDTNESDGDRRRC